MTEEKGNVNLANDIEMITISLNDEKVTATKSSAMEINGKDIVVERKISRNMTTSPSIIEGDVTINNMTRTRKKSIAYSLKRRPMSLPATADGRRLIKNINRVDSIIQEPVPVKKNVALFRMNSIISDPGEQLEGDEPQRQQWDSPVEFLMSCISMSVGLGNVWRFPYTAYKNGGGAFIIPYLLVLLLIGRPLYFLELALGQFSSSGSVKVWDMVPAFYGVGFGQALATSCVVTYYCCLIALAIYYLVVSFSTTLPWTVCDPLLPIGNISCVPVIGNLPSIEKINSISIRNFTSFENDNSTSTRNNNSTSIGNFTSSVHENNTMSSAEIYFKYVVLKEKSDISDGLGTPDINLGVCLAVCWLMLYFTLKNGVSSSGKVAYFTAIFPYAVLFTFLIMACTLPGAGDGVLKFFEPQWEKLLEPGVWYAAVTQSFFSLSIGFGSLITYSSYNKFSHNTNKDALIISFADTGTSLLAGTVVFAILGNMAHELGKPLGEVVASGTGLAFVAYPVVIAKFPFCPQLFAVLFFLMLITLGLGSAVGLTSAVTTVISDALPSVSQQKIVKITCVVGFSLGLAYTTPGGQTALDLVDYFGGSLLILILAVIEVIAIGWIYGTNRIKTDIDFMLKTNFGEGNSFKWWFNIAGDTYWRFCWGIFCPIILSFILLYALATQTGLPGNLPSGAYAIGGIICIVGFLLVPINFAMSVYKGKGTLVGRMAAMFRPADTWGPTGIQDRSDWVGYWEEEGESNPFDLIISKFNKTGGKLVENGDNT